MGMYEIETRTCETKNFFAGDFPTPTDNGIAGETIKERMPITENDEGKIIAVTVETTGDVIGITAAAAESGDPVVYYLTGEFFEEAINMPDGVAVEDIKKSLRRISIFLRN